MFPCVPVDFPKTRPDVQLPHAQLHVDELSISRIVSGPRDELARQCQLELGTRGAGVGRVGVHSAGCSVHISSPSHGWVDGSSTGRMNWHDETGGVGEHESMSRSASM